MEEKHECSGDCGNCETAWSKDLERKVVIPVVDSDPYEWEKDRIFPKKSQYPPQVLEIPADFDYEKSCSKVDDDEHRRAVGRGYITGGHPMFHQLLEKMREIHNAKNADYGDGKQLGNFMEAEDFGVEAWRGALVRLSDKYSRVKSLAKRINQEGEVKDESFEDTLIDLANYALLTLVLYKER